MLRNTLAVAAILALAASSQAAMILTNSAATPLPDTATSTGLVSYTISATATAGEIINGFNDPSLTILLGSGAHQVWNALANTQTGTRQEQLNGTGTIWSDTWLPYDTYFFPTAANSLSVGAGKITETKSPATGFGGATLTQGAALGTPNTGYGTFADSGGTISYAYTVASGLPGTTVAIMQLVQKASDVNTISMGLFNTHGGTANVSLTVFPPLEKMPEPTSLGLLGLALAGCLGFVRRHS